MRTGYWPSSDCSRCTFRYDWLKHFELLIRLLVCWLLDRNSCRSLLIDWLIIRLIHSWFIRCLIEVYIPILSSLSLFVRSKSLFRSCRRCHCLFDRSPYSDLVVVSPLFDRSPLSDPVVVISKPCSGVISFINRSPHRNLVDTFLSYSFDRLIGRAGHCRLIDWSSNCLIGDWSIRIAVIAHHTILPFAVVVGSLITSRNPIVA